VKFRFRLFLAIAALGISAFAITGTAAVAQTAPAPTPAPPAPARHTVVSQEYDGATHLTFTPYVWLPTLNGTFQYRVPNRRPGGGGVVTTSELNTQIGPNSYLTHINFALMGAFELRKGDVGAFGDVINLNVSNSGTTVTSISGPFQKFQIPVDLGSSAHLSSTIWEAGADLTLAHSDSADIQFLTAWRQIRLTSDLDWNLNIGKNRQIARSGSISVHDNIGDVVFGFKGKVALGDGGWFVPYYVDYGAGAPSNNTWQAYGGVGKATGGGSFLLIFRELNYDFDPGSSFIRKVRFGGPLVGYTFKL